MSRKQPKEQITGDSRPKFSLYEMMGLNVNPYTHETVEAYTDYIESLNFSDLHQHAAEDVGVVPIEDREKLLERLRKQYIVVTGQLEANAIQREESMKQLTASKTNVSRLSKDKQKQLKDLLARGR